MSVVAAQPIAGVSANREAEIEIFYPSVAAGKLGQLIGEVMGLANLVPTTPLRLLASIILGIPMSLLAVLAYALNKLFGRCYLLTNRSVSIKSILGSRLSQTIALRDIAQIETSTSGSGYRFHRAGDVSLENAQGNILLTIRAVTSPQRVKQVILEAQAARLLNDESLSVIQNRR